MMTREDYVLLKVCFLEFLLYLGLLVILFFPIIRFPTQ